ncbi:MAG: acetate--CoA ligase family protein [Pseudomonadota bacterium]
MAPANRDLTRLLSPRSIAFIGGRDAAEAIRVCRRFGYEGEIWPVSASRTELAGVAAFKDIASLPGVPDAAFVGVNREASIDVIAQLRGLGAGGAIAYASGFSESISEIDGGADLEARLIAAAGDMPLLGPNCYGFINAGVGASIWPSEHGVARAERGVALISQSTNIAISLTMQRRGLPIAFVGTVGNQAQTGLSSLARAALALPTVTALGLHVEAIDDAAGFEALASLARELGKPIALTQTGRTEAAQNATLSHTASLAGSHAASDAFYRRLGVARLDTLTQLVETLKLLHVHGPLPGGRIASMCCSGGETALLADAIDGRKVVFPPLSDTHRVRVKDTLNDMVRVLNPLDYHTFIWGNEAALTETFSAMMGGGEPSAFDIGLLTLDWVRTDRCSDADWLPTVAALRAAANRSGLKAGTLSTLPDNMPEPIAERLITEGLVPLCGVEDGLSAVEAAAFIGGAWARPAPAVLTPAPRTDRTTRLLDEAAAKAELAGSGVPTPKGRAVEENAVRKTAEEIGGAVAVKWLGTAHKTDLGAVQLGLFPEEAAEAAQEMTDRLGPSKFLVEEMASKPVAELIVGAKRDAPYGVSLTLGAGGVLTELLRDTVTLLLPATREEIRDALLSLRSAPLLKGYRGQEGADIDLAVDAIENLARYAIARADRLLEVEVNPLMVSATGATAVDALIRLEVEDD